MVGMAPTDPANAGPTAPAAAALEIPRALVPALTFVLCVAALAAVVVILKDGFGEGAFEALAIGFAVALLSATGTTGATLLRHEAAFARVLGRATLALSALSFAAILALLSLTTDEVVTKLAGSLQLATLALCHATLTTVHARRADGRVVAALGWTSVLLVAVLACVGLAAIFDLVQVDEGLGQLAAVLFVLALLTTLLAPMLRQPDRAEPARGAHSGLAAVLVVLVALLSSGAFTLGGAGWSASSSSSSSSERTLVAPSPSSVESSPGVAAPGAGESFP